MARILVVDDEKGILNSGEALCWKRMVIRLKTLFRPGSAFP